MLLFQGRGHKKNVVYRDSLWRKRSPLITSHCLARAHAKPKALTKFAPLSASIFISVSMDFRPSSAMHSRILRFHAVMMKRSLVVTTARFLTYSGDSEGLTQLLQAECLTLLL